MLIRLFLSGLWLFCGLVCPQVTWALISGGEGNSPLDDPGWPQGSAQVFNVKARVAWWEGPPFGGGQYTAECRGSAMDFNAVLADFAKIDASGKTLFVHDGVGASFWLNPNGDAAQQKRAAIDWTFTVWVPANFERLKGFRGELSGADASHPVIHLYTGGSLKWADIKVPDGISIQDERLETHGYQTTDGTVLEGKVTDLETNQPLTGQVALQSIKPLPTGGYEYATVRTVDAVNGQWVLKSAPEGWYQVVLSAPGYASRVAHHLTIKSGPRWIPVNAGLLKPAAIEGLVTGPDGQPLADVIVRLDDLITLTGGRYETIASSEFTTGADGRFAFREHPRGSTLVWCRKSGYCRPGLGLSVQSPANDLRLQMVKSSAIEVLIDFGDRKRPDGYIVEIEPEGGQVVGSWGGSGNIDKANQITFRDVPPGKYVLKGRPNPGSADKVTESQIVDLQGGETEPVILEAR